MQGNAGKERHTEQQNTALRALEVLHPALLFATLLPFIGQLALRINAGDTDPNALLLTAEEVRRHVLTGWALLPACALVRLAEAKLRLLSAYLAVCAAILAGVFLMTKGTDRTALLLILLAYMADAVRLRLSENARKRAVKEHDLDWQEESFLFLKPHAAWIAFPVILYLITLFWYNNALCDAVFLSIVGYLVLALFYHYLSARENYLAAHHGLANVPVRRIRRIGGAMIGGLAVCILLLFAVGRILGGERHFLNMPEPEPVEIEYYLETAEEFSYQEPAGELPEELLGEMEVRELPEWLQKLLDAIFYVLGVLIFAGLGGAALLSIRRIFAAFRGREEENGDIAVSLEDPEDAAVRLTRRMRSFFAPRSEREKIRRRYRSIILKHRKKRPGDFETPAEIEAGTDLSLVPDREELHAQYEAARYGKIVI